MTWNVLYKEKADNILSLVKKIDPDIFCGQELTSESDFNPGRKIPEEISANLSASFFFKQTFESSDPETGKNFKMGNGIFTKFPISNKQFVFVRNEDGKEKRAYIQVECNIKGNILRIGTTHLTFEPWFPMSNIKLEEAQKLHKAIDKNTEHFILTGDMNSTAGSKIINRLSKNLASAGPDHKENTWTTKPFSLKGMTADTLDWRLDYIFTTPDVKVLSSKIIKTDYSDHLPILAEIEI